MHRIEKIPLALYIHIPWCVKKCPYCDFNSHQERKDVRPSSNNKEISSSTTRKLDDGVVQNHAVQGDKSQTNKAQANKAQTNKADTLNKIAVTQIADTAHSGSGNTKQQHVSIIGDTKNSSAPDYAGYVDSLIADARQQIDLQQGRTISSIFFGGGTPSLLPIAQLKRLMTTLKAELAITEQTEVTLEVNPGTVEHAPFEEYIQAGINRLSIGVQTFAPDKLQTLGRIHSPGDAHNAVMNAQKAGFTRINIDLMHGLPNQSVEEALYDLKTAIALGADHISWYQLTIEPNTVFYNTRPTLPDEDCLGDIQDLGEQVLIDAGFENYEVSAWRKVRTGAKPCLHNITYWQFGDYLAIGAGAHGKVTSIVDDTLQVERFSKKSLPKYYMANMPPKNVTHKTIAPESLVYEFMMNTLRLKQGSPTFMFSERTGLGLDTIAETCEELVQKKLLEPNWREHLVCTPIGFRYLNTVLNHFEV